MRLTATSSLVLLAFDMCKGSLKGSKLQFGFETHLVRRPLHDAPDDCHPESDLQLSCLLQLLLNCVSQPWRHLMLPHGCPSVQFARVQVMRRLCSTLPTFTHVTLSSCVVVAKWQLETGSWGTCHLPPAGLPELTLHLPHSCCFY